MFNIGSVVVGLDRLTAIEGNLVPVLLRFVGLAACALVAATPTLAQDTAISAAAVPPKEAGPVVEGATPDRVELVNSCGGHKFETLVEVDPVKHRSTRVKLCSKPGASDADWVKTLQSALQQIEQRNMPPEAREKLIAEIKTEIGNYAKPGAATGSPGTGAFPVNFGKGLADLTATPEAPFETSKLPPLVPIKAKPGQPAIVVAPVKPIRATLRCLERGETGKGMSCDFLQQNTVLLLTASVGLDHGGTLRFLRKGDERGMVDIAPTAAGQTRRVPMPAGICKSISRSTVQIEVMAPGATRPGLTLGPLGLRC